MLIQVDDIVINTDQIKYIKINDKLNYVLIYFGEEHSQKVKFPHFDDLDRFLKMLGRDRIFA